MITNRPDAEAFVRTSLKEYADEHDVSAIANELYQMNDGSWDFESIRGRDYWRCVERHAIV